jgi:hypothetical protein
MLLIVFVSLLLSACSYTGFLPPTPTPPPPTALPTNTLYVTPSETPTLTPTQPTPTFTATPTLIYAGPTATASDTPEPTSTLALIATKNPLELVPQSGAFAAVSLSSTAIYWGACEPSSVQIKTQVTGGLGTHTVLLFLRLKDKDSERLTEWGGGAIMDNTGNRIFTYTVTPQALTHYLDFKSAWIQFQLVATDVALRVTGRTQQFLDNLSIAPCP